MPAPHEAERIDAIFDQARHIADLAQRAAYLDQTCAGDRTLRTEIESLLAADQGAAGFMKLQALPALETLPGAKAGDRVGRYKLLEKIGEGGFGEVWMAEQEEPVRRRVAFKIIKLGMDTKEVVARFEAERQALALMDHPNIARVFDGGATESGRPYFVMELVRGVPMTTYCDEHRLSVDERLELFVQVCQAVQHAHQKGIIHRDLKPSNVIVTVLDDRPVPKVIDFGIAKATAQRLTEKTFFTRFQQFVGTPAYMSPEQAGANREDIDTRSDIYSLGVLLYELLTGQTPLDTRVLLETGFEATLKAIREYEPPKPSTRLTTVGKDVLSIVAAGRRTAPERLSKTVRGELDWIVMRALEKDRARRYPTANALGMDVQRHMSNEPVSAAAPTAFYRARKLLDRHRAAIATAGGLVGLLAAGATVSTWEALRANRNAAEAYKQSARAGNLAKDELTQRQRAESMAAQSQQNLYSADIRLAQLALEDGNRGRARALLRAYVPEPGEKDFRGFEWHYLWRLSQGDNFATFLGHSNVVTTVAFAPDGKTLASGSRDNTIRVWDTNSGTCLVTFSAGAIVHSVGYSSDGLYVAAGTEEGVRVWNSKTGDTIFSTKEKGTRVAFSRLGCLLAIGSGGPPFGGGGSARVIDLPSGEEVASFPNSGGRVAFSANSKTLITGDSNGVIRAWDLASQKQTHSLEGAGEVSVLSLSPDGDTLATVSDWSGNVVLWSMASGRIKTNLVGHTGRVWAIAFSPNGDTVATASSDQTVRLWRAASGQLLSVLKGHSSEVWAVAFSPDGTRLATGSKDETLMLWNTFHEAPLENLRDAFSRPVFSADSVLMAAASGSGDVTIWEVASARLKARLPGAQFPVGFASGAATCLTARFSTPPTRYGSSRLLALESWDVTSRSKRTEVLLEHPLDGANSAILSHDGEVLAAGSTNGRITLWRVATGHVLTTFQGPPEGARELAFSPDGQTLALGGATGTAYLWDLVSGREQAALRGHKDGIFFLTWLPGARALATASTDGTIRLWDVDSRKTIVSLNGHKEGVIDVAASPDGRTLASAGSDHSVKLWSLATYREMLSHTFDAPVGYLAFAPDGRTLVCVSEDGRLFIWSTANPVQKEPRGR